MTEKEYRGIMGEGIGYHFIIDPAISKNDYLQYSEKIAGVCMHLLHTLIKDTSLDECSAFVMDKNNLKQSQIAIFYTNEELFFGLYDQRSCKIYPFIEKEYFDSGELDMQLYDIKKRVNAIIAFTPSSVSRHVSPLLENSWLKYVKQWPELEQQYRSEWQIVDQIAPRTPEAYALAKEILDRSNTVYIESQPNGTKTLYLTEKAAGVIQEARDRGAFTRVYEQLVDRQMTAAYLKELQKHPEAITVLGFTDNAISMRLNNPDFKGLSCVLDTRESVFTISRGNKEILKSKPHESVGSLRTRLYKEIRKTDISRDDDER